MTKSRFLLDHDGSTLFHNSRYGESLTRDDFAQIVEETVHELPPEVTTVLLCSNAGTCYYPTRIGVVDPSSKMVLAALAQGVDLFGDLLRAIKATGRETFITMRMNDVHNPEALDAWNVPRIRREHPELIVGADEIRAGKATWMSYCLDYAQPPVQDYFLALVRELVERYADTIDGIQFDWMRFPRHLSGDVEAVWSERQALTEFIARARAILHETNAGLRLAARVPPTLEGCRNLGMDLPQWASRGLVDFLTFCPFLNTNWQIPFGDLRTWMYDTDLPLYGGFDFGYGRSHHHPESLRGICTNLYDCGADGIYLFNFPCWIEYLAVAPYHWLRGLGQPATAAEKPLQLAVDHNYHRDARVDGPGQLPATVSAGDVLSLRIYVPGAALPAWRALLLVQSHGDIRVAVNGVAAAGFRFRPGAVPTAEGRRGEIFVEFVNQLDAIGSRPIPQDCRHFRLDPTCLRPGVNTIEITNAEQRDLEIERVKLALW